VWVFLELCIFAFVFWLTQSPYILGNTKRYLLLIFMVLRKAWSINGWLFHLHDKMIFTFFVNFFFTVTFIVFNLIQHFLYLFVIFSPVKLHLNCFGLILENVIQGFLFIISQFATLTVFGFAILTCAVFGSWNQQNSEWLFLLLHFNHLFFVFLYCV